MGTTVSHLALIDWIIILGFIMLSLGIGVVLSRRGRKSVRDYFISGGSTPWWLLGTSMVATTFASDTPLTLAGWVVTTGIAQNWFWWCQVPITLLGVFFIARLWRRAQLITDMEYVYLRYSGKSASVLRGFKAFYLALIYNCIVMGWVNLAMTKIIKFTVPEVPRIAVVDTTFQSIYLNTPLSHEIPARTRSILRSGEVNAVEFYHDRWHLYRNPARTEVMADLDLAVRRIKALKTLEAAIEKAGPGGVEPEQLEQARRIREYAAGLDPEAFFSRLGITGWGQELEPVLAGAPGAGVSAELPLSLGILAGVNTAAEGVHKLKIIFFLFVVVVVYTVISGLWGVLVTDFVQFWIAMAGCIALAVLAVRRVGGLEAVFTKMADLYTVDRARGMVSVIPVSGAGDLDLLPWSYFLVFILFAWYVVGFTDGGSYFAQRMLAAKNERHAALGYLWYAIAHYCLRMWPWVIVGFVAAVMFPYTKDVITGQLPGQAVAEDGYIKVMLAVLPAGLLGIMIAAFLAAYMSTISAQLNLGASYVLNDLYRPFIRKGASEKHYVVVSQIATMFMAMVGLIISLFYSSISGAWFFLATLNAGIGVIYLLRWFWWRINAWTEISCILALLLYAVLLKLLEQPLTSLGIVPASYPLNLLYLVPYSVGTALIITLLTRPTEKRKLIEFVKRVQPGGPGWRKVEAEIRATEPGFRSQTPFTWANLRRWVLGTVGIYCFLFGIERVIVGDAFTAEPWIPARLVGTLLMAASVFLVWFAVRDFSEKRWDAK